MPSRASCTASPPQHGYAGALARAGQVCNCRGCRLYGAMEAACPPPPRQPCTPAEPDLHPGPDVAGGDLVVVGDACTQETVGKQALRCRLRASWRCRLLHPTLPHATQFPGSMQSEASTPGTSGAPPPPAPPPTVIDHPDGRRPQLLRQQQVLKQAQPVGGPVAPPGQHGRQGEGGSLRGVGCGEQLGPLPGSTAEWPCSSPLHAFLHSEPSALSLQGSSSTLYPG